MSRRSGKKKLKEKIRQALEDHGPLKTPELKDKLWNDYAANILYGNKQSMAQTISNLRKEMEGESIRTEEAEPERGSMKTHKWRLNDS